MKSQVRIAKAAAASNHTLLAHVPPFPLAGIYTNKFDASLNMKNGFPVFSTLIEANYILNLDDANAQVQLPLITQP